MKSVLISVDFIYKQDGTLHATELNTSTKDDLTVPLITNDNFLEELDGYFDHEVLNSFMISNNLQKIMTITTGGDDRIFKAFSDYYGYSYERMIVGYGQITVPDVEDSDDTLIVRIAYDTYALIDDLYARDNYEFHNLIKGESFTSPVTFTENDFDTINEFEPSQDGKMPNYIIKARTPGYRRGDYPKGYRLDNVNELNTLKQNLGDDEFIAKFEFNDSLSLVYNRTHHLRTMSLICGSNLEVLNLIHYKSLNSISTENELLVFESEIDNDKKLNDLFVSKYYPTFISKNGLNFHSDSTDLILKPDNTVVSFSDIQKGDEIKNIQLTNQYNFDDEYDLSLFENPTLGISEVVSVNSVSKGAFINLTASHESIGTFSWYDGIGNSYMIKKRDEINNKVLWRASGEIEIGDEILVFNKETNKLIKLKVENLYYDIKDLGMYLISLKPNPQFLVKLSDTNENIFLIQHNGCIADRCNAVNPLYSCATRSCNDCGKSAPYCQNCGGFATTYCL